MSGEQGYNGRAFKIRLNGTVIAAVQSKTVTRAREGVDVTNDDSNGWRIILPDPAVRSVDVSTEGVCTSENFDFIYDEWAGTVNSDIDILNPDGSVESAEFGFFIGNVENSGSNDGHVAFTASFQSSGEVTKTPAP